MLMEMIKPRLVVWICTSKCNLNCIHCYTRGRFPAQELNTDKALKLIDEVARLEPRHVSFTGGEPLLRKDIFTLLERANEYDFSKDIVTNSTTITREVAKKLYELDVNVIISLDAASKETYMKMRGWKWEKALEAVKILAEEGVYFTMIMTITKLNVHEVSKFIELNIEHEAGHATFIPIIPVRKETVPLMPSKDEMLKALKDIEETAEEHYYPVSLWCTPFAKAFIKSKYVFIGSCIGAGLDIDPLGDVLLCDTLDERIANIWRDGIENAWRKVLKHPLNNDQKTVEELQPPCSQCPYKYKCRGGCKARALLINGSFNAQDPLCPIQ